MEHGGGRDHEANDDERHLPNHHHYGRDRDRTYYCRIHGLTSVKGRRLNGCAGLVAPHFLRRDDRDPQLRNRLPTLIDGVPGPPVLLQRSNLELYPMVLDVASMEDDGPYDVDVNVDVDPFVCGIGVGLRSPSLENKEEDTNQTKRPAQAQAQAQAQAKAQWNATSVDVRSGTVITQDPTTGGRCQGNLLAMEQFLKLCVLGLSTVACSGDSDPTRPLLFLATDLNVARAVNRRLAGTTTTDNNKVNNNDNNNKVKNNNKVNNSNNNDNDGSGVPVLSPRLAKLVDLVGKQRTSLLVKFEPHRLPCDGFVAPHDSPPYRARYDAYRTGRYVLYPAPCHHHRDATEVRYLDVDCRRRDSTIPMTTTIRHELFLCYGESELREYVKNATALGERERLTPKILAQVDPSTFWSALRHYKVWLEALASGVEQRDPIVLWSQWDDLTSPSLTRNRDQWNRAISIPITDQDQAEREREPMAVPVPRLPVHTTHGIDWSSVHDDDETRRRAAMVGLRILLDASVWTKKDDDDNDDDDNDNDDKAPSSTESGPGSKDTGSGSVRSSPSPLPLPLPRIELLECYQGTETESDLKALVHSWQRDCRTERRDDHSTNDDGSDDDDSPMEKPNP